MGDYSQAYQQYPQQQYPQQYSQQYLQQYDQQYSQQYGQQYSNVEPTTQSYQAQNNYTASSISDIKKYDQRGHVYDLPDTYIGGVEFTQRPEYIFNFETQTIIHHVISLPPGVERLFLEILSNACDNVYRSRNAGLDPKRIDVVMTNSTITVTNYGNPIPVLMHPEYKEYGPSTCFGQLLSGTNFTDNRGYSGGRNGYGASLTNVFSHVFEATVYDHLNHAKFYQRWTKNMINAETPIVEPYSGTESSVSVTYYMDFEKFKMVPPNGDTGGYPPEAFMFFARHTIDASFTRKITTTFNGTSFYFPSPKALGKLYFGEEIVKNGVLHYEWPAGAIIGQGGNVIVDRDGYQHAVDGITMPLVELLAVDTLDNGRVISFANAIATKNGGTHANEAIRAFSEKIVEDINRPLTKKPKKDKKKSKGRGVKKDKLVTGKEKKDETVERVYKININDVKQNVSILLNCNFSAVKFDSQSKYALTYPNKLHFNITEEELKPVDNWQLLNRLYRLLAMKEYNQLIKTDGRQVGRFRSKKVNDANNVGKPGEWYKCVLCAAEGDSAAGYITKQITFTKTKRDYIGIIRFKGKPLNIMKASIRQIAQSEEIKNLKGALGLREGLDYTLDENFATLRYGKLLICTDADDDGNHITGLIILIFKCLYPSLLARGFIVCWTSSKYVVKHGRSVIARLSDDNERLQFEQQIPDWEARNYRMHYMKGLGTSSNDDIKANLENPRIVSILYDDQSEYYMNVAFNPKQADDRKKWIAQYQQLLGFEGYRMEPLSNFPLGNFINQIHLQRPLSWFINLDLVRYAIANLKRSIPAIEDNLKDVQRKIIAATIKRFKVHTTSPVREPVKVAQLAAYIAEHYDYHHGEDSISKAIHTMAWEFAGSNNLPLFLRDGQLGTRDENGKDAANSRYTHTAPDIYFPYIFRKEDEIILKYIKEGNDTFEPERYYPIIPLWVNGVVGIATGDSSSMPNYDPMVISDWLKGKLLGWPAETLPRLTPWYRGFSGQIYVIDRKKRDTMIQSRMQNSQSGSLGEFSSDEFNSILATDIMYHPIRDESGQKYETEEQMTYYQQTNAKHSMVSVGKFHIEGRKIIITEIPIGRSMGQYRTKFLDDLIEKKELTSYRDNSDAYVPYFELNGYKGKVTYQDLHLISTKGMSNIVFLNSNDRPVHYTDVYQVIETYYKIRLEKYDERRLKIIEQYSQEITKLDEKARFIQAVLDGQLIVIRPGTRKAVPLTEIHPVMDTMGFRHALLSEVKTIHYSEEQVAKLRGQIDNLSTLKTKLEGTDPRQIWYNELVELDDVYQKYYNQKENVEIYGSLPPRAICGPQMYQQALTQ